ncbi:iron-containing alcohol dehydrogenase [Natranaerobius thermophilus]|uniref:Iron-containing alcohol dehydrogenase n=1 Tax=Natranaerobius thermophilus (strain ATCC BAA-1301 / DSM 18059 / JW/NM-WN-LF) TaxID=457570 RepID=B2A730_NATTJ|nr:iron-containing alcohol dehydrogenase [Natranaerobius thermophilus]ACB85621.1 iron-containing alcohol dehydrogenase [Natranaerobius thermophilus JW/NM-WN-LF]
MLRFEQMQENEFVLPTKTKHGLGIIKEIANELKELNVSKPIIVADKGVIDAGLIKPIEESLNEAGIPYAVYDGVEADPDLEIVANGTKAYKKENCDGMIAVGGGSSMDTAKAMGLEISHDGPVVEYEAAEGKKPMTKRIPPLVTVPTTAGTGSEVTLWAVIKDPEREFKFNTGGPLITAHLALIDPELHVTMPPSITAGTGMDALCHAIECYTCHYSQPTTDAAALLAIEYAGKYLRRAVGNGQDIEARYGMAMSAMLAGISYGGDSAGAVHAMTQTLGGIISVPHGQAVAATLAPAMEYNWIGAPHKFARIANALGVDTHGMDLHEAARASVEAVYQLSEDIDVPTLGDLGVSEDMIPRLAKEAYYDPQTVGNPRDIDVKGYEEIYRSCF